MNKNFLLIATLAGLASTASAASSQTAAEVFELPAERKITASLAELRKVAKVPVAIAPELNLLKVREVSNTRLVSTTGSLPGAKS
jgi:hypothetical protein